jgi:hypothetical protein
MIAENRAGKQGDPPGLADLAAGYPRWMRTLSKISLIGLVAYGGYWLWNRHDRRGTSGGASDRRISGRSSLTAAESAVGSDDPVAQASAILADSDDRTQLARDAPGIERRHSEDTVEP